jgi:hypothetical protein
MLFSLNCPTYGGKMNSKRNLFGNYVFVSLLSFFLLFVALLPSAAYAAEPKTQANSDDQIPHTFGVGIRLGGSSFGVGANARYWIGKRVGAEIGYSHYSLGYSSSGFGYNSSANQVIPSFLFALSRSDHPGYQLRPYIGGGINVSRFSSSAEATGYGINIKESSTNTGGQGFAGLELTFKKVPRLTFGGEAGYYSTSIPYSGMKFGGVALALTIHYYLK